MVVRLLIKDHVPPLLTTDSAERALAWMRLFKLRCLPVVKGTEFLGLVSEEDLEKLPDHKATLAELSPPLNRVFLYHQQHLFDAVNFVTNHECPVVPVLDEENHYAGLVTWMDLVEGFAELSALHAEGGIIQLEVNKKDYMLSEMASLVEAHDASIIHVGAVPSPDNTKMDVTLKVNRVDLTRILAAFNRYHYHVTGYYHQSEFSEDLQDRYDAFMKYLNM